MAKAITITTVNGTIFTDLVAMLETGAGGLGNCRTAPTKRYPRLGIVSMYGGSSPRALRKTNMLLERLPSSTKESGQSVPMSSSFSRRWPLLRTKSSRVSKALGVRTTGSLVPFGSCQNLCPAILKEACGN